MSEAALWSYLRRKILPPGIHATRIESRVSVGFPDVHYTYHSRSGTLELKFLRKKKPPFGKEGLNLDQRIWHRDNWEAGGTSFIIAEVTSVIFVVKGAYATEFNDWTQEDLDQRSKLVLTKRHIDQADLGFFAGLLENKYA